MSLPFNPSTLPTTSLVVCDTAYFDFQDSSHTGGEYPFPDSQINSPWGGSQYVQYFTSDGRTFNVKPDRYDNISDAFLFYNGARRQEHTATRNWTSSPNGTGITMMDMVGR
jgi:hypothetical protein